ncbi:MAG: hypothetical protein LUE92_16730 [Clostridiales bacterium]|nr:hypothetical protein [Clostridiales bacterium]
MEMCYDGALVMPSSYVLMSEEEMTYLEGGKYYGVNFSASKCSKIASNLSKGSTVFAAGSVILSVLSAIPGINVVTATGVAVCTVGTFSLSLTSSFFSNAASKGGCHVGWNSTTKKWSKGYGTV